jgi:hypothetical protein
VVGLLNRRSIYSLLVFALTSCLGADTRPGLVPTDSEALPLSPDRELPDDQFKPGREGIGGNGDGYPGVIPSATGTLVAFGLDTQDPKRAIVVFNNSKDGMLNFALVKAEGVQVHFDKAQEFHSILDTSIESVVRLETLGDGRLSLESQNGSFVRLSPPESGETGSAYLQTEAGGVSVDNLEFEVSCSWDTVASGLKCQIPSASIPDR